MDVLAEQVVASLKTAKSRNIPLSSTEMTNSILQHLDSHPQTFIIIDGFDEVLQESTRIGVFNKLNTLITESFVKVLITSRPSSYELPPSVPKLEISAASYDMEAYIKTEMEQNPKFHQLDQKKILSVVLKKASGM